MSMTNAELAEAIDTASAKVAKMGTGPERMTMDREQTIDRLWESSNHGTRREQHWSVIDGIGDTLRADQLDAAIDAAMALHNA